mgnify:CR=1 FL=1
MAALTEPGRKLGINGLGRIGKLTLWHHVARKAFAEVVVNLGRAAGKSLADVAHYIERDSTYGWLHGYLYGHQARPVITEVDEKKGTLRIGGKEFSFKPLAGQAAEIFKAGGLAAYTKRKLAGA